MLLLHPGMTKRIMLMSGGNHNLGGQNSSRLQAGSMYIYIYHAPDDGNLR